MKTAILYVTMIVLLTACGGSSTGSNSIETLWRSPTNSGAGLIRAVNNTNNSIALVEDVNDAGGYQSFELVETITETQNSDGSYSGEYVLRMADGSRTNIIARIYGPAALYANVSQNSTAVVAGGLSASNLPVGNYSYSGFATSLYIYGGSAYEENGSFSMDVQFRNQTAQLNARTAESQYYDTSIVLNNAGELTGNGIFIVYDTDGVTELERRSIAFNGTLHGSGATHVSGVAVGGATTTDDFSVMAIVGSR